MKNDQPCTRGSGCCVTGDTRILTPMGMERIDSLYRLAKSRPVTVLTKIAGELREVAVVNVHTDSEAKDLYKVTLDDGCFVVLTGYHGMLLAGVADGWPPPIWHATDTLRVGDPLDGRTVKSIERVTSPVMPTLYDLELCEGDGYIANGIMVRAFVRETANAK